MKTIKEGCGTNHYRCSQEEITRKKNGFQKIKPKDDSPG